MLLVTGATGNLGRGIIDNILRMPLDRKMIVAATHRPESDAARQIAEAGIEVRRLDYMDPASIDAALRGIHKMLMISTWDTNDVRVRQHANAVDGAVRAGVQHIIYTSFINASPDSLFDHNAQVHAVTEAKIRATGITYTFLRHGLYAESTMMDLQQTLTTGKLLRGGGNARISFIGLDDLAISSATVLISEGHENTVYTETGPEALTYAEVAKLMSGAFGRFIEHVDLTPEQWYEHALSMGFPEPTAHASKSNVLAVRAGEMGTVTCDYEKITGRMPRSFRQLLAENRDKYLNMYAPGI
jgi:NAD(P)H dehydrogenase (quinone)